MSADKEYGQIEESLQRSFKIPDLSGLEKRIEAATLSENRALDDLASRRKRVVLVATATLVVAAAIVLLWRTGDVAQSDRKEVTSNARRQESGAKLAMFVSDRSLPPPGNMSCVGEPGPTETCADAQTKPRLPIVNEVEVIGECGACGGPICKGGGLPAATGLQLRMLPSGQRFFVAMDLLVHDSRPVLPESSDLRIFRRVLGDYVIYEVTPLAEPQVLNLFAL